MLRYSAVGKPIYRHAIQVTIKIFPPLKSNAILAMYTDSIK